MRLRVCLVAIKSFRKEQLTKPRKEAGGNGRRGIAVDRRLGDGGGTGRENARRLNDADLIYP